MKRFLFINLLFFSTFLFAQEISDYKFQCKSLLSKSGKLFLDLKNDQSIKLANEALNLAIQNNDDEIAAKAYNLIGLNYSDFSEINKAIETYKKGLLKANKTNNDTIKSWLTNNLANAYCYNEVDFNEGIKYYKLALQYSQKLNYEYETAFTKLNLVSALFRVANYQEGIDYLIETKDFVDQTDDVEVKITFYSLYADYFNNESNDFNKAEEYYLIAFNYSKNNEIEFIQSHVANLYKDISTFYSKHKKFEEAYHFSKMSDSLNTIIYNAERIESVANISKDVEKNEVERNLFEIKQEKKLQEEKLKTSKIIFLLFIVIFTFLFLLLLSLYKNNRLRKEKNEELERANLELKLAKEKAEEASNIKSQFISTISHELRTPLYGVIGTTDIIEEEHKELSNSPHLKALKFSANYLLSLVNDILKVYKIEENKVILEDNIFNLSDVIDNIKESLETIARRNNNKIEINIDNRIPQFLIGDKIRLSQIIINLMSNSLKFTQNGKVVVNVDLDSVEGEKIFVKFKVMDTGIGIPEKYQKTVFDKFVQIERKEDDYQGTGLGLTIVKKLISLFKGSIDLQSEEGKGTTITFIIPFKKGNSKNQDFIENVEVDFTQFKPYNILVVEDNKINQVVTKRLLENHKFICDIVDDGFAALNNLETKSYDAILMDINMPKINGFETSKLIRAKGITTPIIAVTAFAKEEIIDKAKDAQINDVVVKPFEASKLFQIIHELITKLNNS
ncbi:MAG: response regulator [Flavobacteriaceae bacterium]|nr:response regulator [Flavobacteriaceae bacterium]